MVVIDKSSEFYDWYVHTHHKSKRNLDEIAVIYARYSSHSQGEQSIEGQIAAARKYAEAKGYTVIHEYIDRAMTGRNDNRDEFQKMLSDCAKKQFSVIIVWKVDRFGRNRQEITFNKYRARKHGVRVEYVAESLPDAPEAVILESVLEGMAEYYSIQLSQNVRRGMEESAKKHRVLRKPPLGYRVAADHTHEIDPETAPIVKMIFDMYAEGRTMSEVVEYLNANGYKTVNGNAFTKNSLPRILSCEKYIGVYTYKDVMREEDVIPPIIDKEVFQRVQEMLKVNKRQPSRKWSYTDFLLTGKLFCGMCGSTMVGESGFGKSKNKYAYYTCLERKRAKRCTKKPVRKEMLEEAVLNGIRDVVQNDEVMDFIVERTWDYYTRTDEDRDNLNNLNKQLADVQKGTANLVRSLEAGILNDAITARLDELREQEMELKKAIAEIDLAGGIRLTKEHIRYFLEQFRGMDVSNRDCQQRLVDVFVNSIYVYDDHFTILFNFGSEKRTITLPELTEVEEAEGSDAVCNAPPQRSFKTN